MSAGDDNGTPDAQTDALGSTMGAEGREPTARPAAGTQPAPAETADDGDDALYSTLDGGTDAKSEGEGDAKVEPALGVPDAPDGYAVPEIEGIAWNDADKAVFASVFEAAHEGEITQAGMNRLARWYAENAARTQQEQKASDASNANVLREAIVEAGGEDGFKAEIGKVKQHLNAMPLGLGKEITKARLPNGRLLGHDPRFVHFFANLSASGAPADEAREAKLLKIMKEDPAEYQRKGQKELSDLRARMPPKAPPKPDAPRSSLSPVDQRRKQELRTMMQDDPNRYFNKGGRGELAEILEREEQAKRR